MKPFASLGNVTRVDITTVDFDAAQLAATEDVTVPGSIERLLQLLSEEPGKQLLAPFKETDDNVRGTKARSMAFILMIFIEQDLILKEDKGAYNHV
jgi:hypothetical protein